MQGNSGDHWLKRHASVRGAVMTVATAVVAAIVVLTLMHKPGGAPAYTPAATTPEDTSTAPLIVDAPPFVEAPTIATPEPSAAPSTTAAPPPPIVAPSTTVAFEPSATPTATAAPTTSTTPTTTTPPTTTNTLPQYHQPPAPTAWAPNQVHR